MMNDQRMTQVSAEELNGVVFTFIERETQDMGEMEASLFYEALEEIFADEAMIETIEL